MSEPAPMTITALAPWFGGCRSIADRIGPELGRLAWCGVPFAGGLPELPGIQTQAGVATDLHRHVINLARVVADDVLLPRLVRRVSRLIFHDDEHADACRRCMARERSGGDLFGGGSKNDAPSDLPDVEWAADYFVVCWMGRGGSPGCPEEFTQRLSVRYTASGGSSSIRWRSAVESLPAWHRALDRWQFVREDAFELLARLEPLKPESGRAGIYADPPWVEEGTVYRYPFSTPDHRRLAGELRRLSDGGYRIAVRYGDCALVRKLYSGWRFEESKTRDQSGGSVAEVLIVNGPSLTEGLKA